MLKMEVLRHIIQRFRRGNVKGPQHPVRHADDVISWYGGIVCDFPNRL
jgi:hypothetical protein